MKPFHPYKYFYYPPTYYHEDYAWVFYNHSFQKTTHIFTITDRDSITVKHYSL